MKSSALNRTCISSSQCSEVFVEETEERFSEREVVNNIKHTVFSVCNEGSHIRTHSGCDIMCKICASQARQNPGIEEEGRHETSLLAEELFDI